ncbi:MAG: PQQ-binding-like beta-propeller repeat protein, partial [Pirellulales bacterium]
MSIVRGCGEGPGPVCLMALGAVELCYELCIPDAWRGRYSEGDGARIRLLWARFLDTSQWEVSVMISSTQSYFSWLFGNRCRKMVTLAAMLLVVEIVSGNVFADNATKSAPWSMFRSNAQHSGLSLSRGPQTATQQWALRTGDKAPTSAAIGADGTIYVGVHDKHLYAIHPDGSLKWRFPTVATMGSCPALGADGMIYVPDRAGNLYAIDPDGRQRWKLSLGCKVYSSPTIGANGTIYLGADDRKLHAINPDGTPQWTYAAKGKVQSTAAMGRDGTIFVGANDHQMYAINSDGTIRWTFETGGVIESSPAIGNDGTIYVGSVDKNLYAINADGTLLWHFALQGKVGRSPAIGFDRTLYIAGTDGVLYAIGPTTNTAAETVNAQSNSALASDNTRAPFCYLQGQTRLWPILSGELSPNETFLLVARREGEVLAEGSELEFSGISVSVSPNGRLKIASAANAEKISFELEISLRTSEGTTTSQRLEVRPAPPDRPITYLADLGDDLIYTFHDLATG